MGLTQVGSGGIKDDAITDAKLPANSVGNSEMKDDAVGVAELSATGTASSSTFLRGDNSWQTVNTSTEGEDVTSTTNSNEANTKFLRADGDGTCSWQVPPDTNTTYSIQDGELSQNNFTNADHTKLDGIEASATADQTGAEIKSAYEGEADTNAYTDAEKTKLAGIAASAEVNVQSDWNASSGDAQILNKPTIPAAQVQSDWNATSGLGEVLNKPTIPSAQVSSDWNSTSSPTEILNKPTVPTVTGSTNNTITTVTGANAIQGEANLTFDGTKLSHTPPANGSNDGFVITPAGGTTASSFAVYGNNNAGAASGRNGGVVAIDANYYATGSTIFSVAGRGTNVLEAFGNGNVEISDGDLVIGTSGHGIDFSASSNVGGMTSELLDDYEVGSFTPTVSGSTGTGSPVFTGSQQWGKYTKIGSLIYVMFDFTISSWSGASGDLQIGLPWSSRTWSGSEYFYPSPAFWFIDTNFTGTNNGAAGNYRTGYIPNNSTAMKVYIVNDNGVNVAGNVNTTGRIAGSIIYMTD